MVRSGVTKTGLFLLRETKRAELHVSKIRAEAVVQNPMEQARVSSKAHETESLTASYWTPHPRTGIYVPKGHEHVIDDVPKNSPFFEQTFWLRNIDGVEKPDHDLPTEHYFHAINTPLN